MPSAAFACRPKRAAASGRVVAHVSCLKAKDERIEATPGTRKTSETGDGHRPIERGSRSLSVTSASGTDVPPMTDTIVQ
jgi:hypothetical protein